MAYISRDFKFMFLSAPATGSSAIIKALSDNGIGEYYPPADIVADGKRLAPKKHTSVVQLEDQGLLEAVNSYYRFVGIRNPFSWHVAKYLRNRVTRAKQADNPNSWINKLPQADRDRYVRQLKRQLKMTFPEFLESSVAGKDAFEPQADFHVGIDLYIHQERMDEDFERLKRDVGLPAEITVPRFNVTNAMGKDESYKDFYTPDLIALVYKANAPFFERFPEYSFEGLES